VEDIDRFTVTQAINPLGIAFVLLGDIAGVVGGVANENPVAIIVL